MHAVIWGPSIVTLLITLGLAVPGVLPHQQVCMYIPIDTFFLP